MRERLVVVTGASGAGKTSIVDDLIAQGIGGRIITCTTRSPRSNNGVAEVDGVDYRFLSEEEFLERLARDEFAEHANVYGRHYGTLRTDISDAMARHGVAFAIVDVQGAQTLQTVYPDALTVFVDVSKEELRERLTLRGERAESVERRMAAFNHERSMSGRFALMIENKNGSLKEAIETLKAALGT